MKSLRVNGWLMLVDRPQVIKPGQPTFEEIYKGNSNADVYAIERSAVQAHKALRDSLKASQYICPYYWTILSTLI